MSSDSLVGLLVAFTRSEISEGDLLVALKLKTCKEATDQEKNNRSTFHPIHFPLKYIVLIEPALTRFENKAKLKLCRYGKTNTRLSESAEQSIEDSGEESNYPKESDAESMGGITIRNQQTLNSNLLNDSIL